jgi:homoserine kinase
VSRPPRALRVSAPASSANLGPGFDALAVALELRNVAELAPARDGGVRVVCEGEGAGELPRDRENLFVRAFERAGASAAGVEVRLRSRIPLARGLGSSAATIVAGLLAGRAWARAADEDLLEPACELEGHADNVAAALAGGLTIAWRRDGGAGSLRLPDPPVDFVLAVPEERLSTARARAALPSAVPHGDAVHTSARSALLVGALAEGRLDLLPEALEDRLHEPYRAPLVPLLGEVRARLRWLSAYGATLSGAGPSVLVWCERGAGDAVAFALSTLRHVRLEPLALAERGALLEDVAG